MNITEGRVVSRREIMTLGGISSQLLSTWKRRHASFPRARSSEEGEFYVLAEVIEWLRDRPIPAASLLPSDELPGSTYADRIARNSRTRAPSRSSRPVTSDGSVRARSGHANAIAELYGPLAERISGGGSSTEYLQLVLGAVFVRVRDPESWGEISHLAERAVAQPHTEPAILLASVAAVIDRVMRERGVLPGLGPVFARLRPTAVGDVAQVLRTCRELDRSAFPALLDRFVLWSPRANNEFVTPAGIVELVTATVVGDAADGFRCHDPHMRFGEFLSGAAAGAENVKVSGAGRDREQLRVAGMSSALQGADVTGLLQSAAAPLGSSVNRPVGVDFVMTNPPFNQKTSGEWPAPNGYWPFGKPPKKNGNFAWLQHVYASLKKGGGRAGVVMPNQAGTSEDPAELSIRAAMIDAGVVECVIALPAGLFATTPVPVSIWILTHSKKVRDSVLLIDARSVGEKRSGQRYLSEHDVQTIVNCHRAWVSGRTELGSVNLGRGNIALAVGRDEIGRRGYSLSPADYRLIPGEPTAAKMVSLGELCDVKAGPSNDIVKTLDIVDEGVPLIAPAQLRHRRVAADHARRVLHADADRLKRFRVQASDILCVRTGTLGPCALVDPGCEGMLFSTGLIRLRVEVVDVVDPRYLIAFLSLSSTVAWIENKAAGTSIPSISSSNLSKLFVPLPSLGEQRRIGAEVAASDEEIALLHRKVQDLDKQRVDTAVALFANLPRG
ncbi:N-6 DNA methylase [Nocardia sp. NPDC023852]|uniref:type I restriction-modification system subunit M/S n=1 Tax=Nocardia sp. NPDC023852 TaxID=3154697 RepID=UPI0033FA6396